MATAAFADDNVSLTIESPKAAAAAIFKDEKGDVHPLNPQQHKLSAVHFWATWCAPCVAELPQVDAAQQAYGDKGLRVVAISLDGDNNMPKVKQFFADHKIEHLTPYLDFGNASFKGTAAKGLPATVFIDSEGKEIARANGPLDWKKVDTTGFIESHLK